MLHCPFDWVAPFMTGRIPFPMFFPADKVAAAIWQPTPQRTYRPETNF
jgi:hypothetical protein